MGLRILFKNKVKTGKKIIQLGTKLIHWLMFPYIYHLPVIFYFPFSFNFPPIKWDWVLLQGCEKTKKDCEISGWVVIDLECLWNHSIRFLWSNVQKTRGRKFVKYQIMRFMVFTQGLLSWICDFRRRVDA